MDNCICSFSVDVDCLPPFCTAPCLGTPVERWRIARSVGGFSLNTGTTQTSTSLFPSPTYPHCPLKGIPRRHSLTNMIVECLQHQLLPSYGAQQQLVTSSQPPKQANMYTSDQMWRPLPHSQGHQALCFTHRLHRCVNILDGAVFVRALRAGLSMTPYR